MEDFWSVYFWPFGRLTSHVKPIIFYISSHAEHLGGFLSISLPTYISLKQDHIEWNCDTIRCDTIRSRLAEGGHRASFLPTTLCYAMFPWKLPEEQSREWAQTKKHATYHLFPPQKFIKRKKEKGKKRKEKKGNRKVLEDMMDVGAICNKKTEANKKKQTKDDCV